MPYSSSTACTSWYRAATDQWRRFLKEGFGQKFRGSAAVDHGRIIADDTPERLKAIHVGDKIILGFDHETEAASAASRIPHLHLAGTLVGVVILSAFCLGLGALSYTLALASKNQEWLFWTVQQTLLFPLLLL
ncbi:MAG TPA: hypothetical protein VGQ92_22770, partial [Actinoplanes sp.]|nr:hypothetical protein [Actinoplanes sp.]